MDFTILSNLAMFLLVLGTLPSIWSAIKSRENLKGFNLFGTFTLLIGQAIFFIFFFLIGDYITSIFSTVPIAYWLVVSYYILKEKFK